MTLKDHVAKRNTAVGRWLPFSLYIVNIVLWFFTGILIGRWQLLWLAVLPLPALGLYLVRTQVRKE